MMSSMDKLGANTGNSLNFDGASLQHQQEDEYRREEELQQNELRALLTNAFDDLSDEDDILSDITSEDGADSRNISLHRRNSTDSVDKSVEFNKISETPVHDKGWENNNNIRKSTESTQPLGGIRLSRTAEFSRGQLESLRASIESLPNYPSRHLVRESGSDITREATEQPDSHATERESVTGGGSVRSSVEDFTAFSDPYDTRRREHFCPRSQGNHVDPSLQYPTHDHQGSTDLHAQFSEHQYGPAVGHGHYMQDYHHHHLHHNLQHDHYHHQPDINQQQLHHHQQEYNLTHHHHNLQEQQQQMDGHHVDHHGFSAAQQQQQQPQQHNPHHHFKKIYQDRPYHTIGEREETEGGNVIMNNQYFHLHHLGYGFQSNQDAGCYGEGQEVIYPAEDQSQNSLNSIGMAKKADGQIDAQKHVKGNDRAAEPGRKRRELPVVYKRDEEEDNEATKDKITKGGVDRQFLQQEGSGEQLAQLQILYQARGRKIEELNQQLELQKNDSGRELRILKHQLSVLKGEKEGASQSVGSLQSLLQEVKEESSQLRGRLSAAQSHVEALTHSKEDLIQKLKTAETTIESLHEHIQELGSSESLSRARQEHESVVSGLQKKYETEIKHLQTERDQLSSRIQDQSEEISRLKQQLDDSVHAAEQSQISRAETINRLTQSLEESQRRCRNLLDSTSAQDLGQMKLQLQQALAARAISDEMCSSLQDELNDVKEQLQMVEAASSLGLGTSHSDQNDSMADLGIKRTLDFDDTPVNTPVRGGGGNTRANVSGDVVSSLKTELERCLVNNKKKRAELSELRETVGSLKKELASSQQRCEKAEFLSQEQKRRITELETTLGSADGTNPVEDRLKKDIDKLRREKSALMEDVQELRGRLEEVSNSEERLTDLNRELSKQIAEMVREYDQDKRQALDSLQRACEQVSETSRANLRQELTEQHKEEQQKLIDKYEEEVETLRSELKGIHLEVDDVKELYVKVCEEKDMLQTQLDAEWKDKLDQEVIQLRDKLKKEEQEALVAMETKYHLEGQKQAEKLRKDYEAQLLDLTEVLGMKEKSQQISEVNQLRDVILENVKASKSASLELERLKVSIVEKEKTIEEAGTAVEQLKAEVVHLTSNVSEKEKEVIEIRKEMKEKDNDAVKLREELKEKNDEVARLSEELKAKQEEVVKFQSEIEELRLDVSEQLDKSCEQQRDVETLEGEITEKDNFIAEQARVVERLIADLDTAVNELDNFKLKARTDLDNAKSDLEEAVAKHKSELDKVVEQLAEKDAEVVGLQEEVEKILSDKSTEVNKLMKKLEEKEEELQKEQSERSSAGESEHLRFEQQLLANVEKMSSLTEDLEQKCEEVNRLKGVINDLEEKCANSDDEKLELRQKCNELDARCGELERKCAEMENKCAELERKCGAMENECRNWERKCADLEAGLRAKEGRQGLNGSILGDGEEDTVKREIEKNTVREKQAELDKMKKELICLKYELVRLENEKKSEAEKISGSKQAEINNLVKKHQGEMDRLRKEKQQEIDRVKQEKNGEIQQLRRLRGEGTGKTEEMESSRLKEVKDAVRREMEDNIKKTLDTRVAMAKVAWLEEHRVTRQTAIDNAVRLAEAELRQKMEEELDQKLQQRIDQEIQKALEAERQNWALEVEERVEAERESWREVELETERLRWSLDTQRQLEEARREWGTSVLKPAKEAWKNELQETIDREKENWRCTELETEKLRLLQEYEERLSQEQKRWKAELTRKGVELSKKEAGLEEKWRREILPEILNTEREKWVKDLGDRVQQKLNKTFAENVESEVQSRLTTERHKLEKESEAKVLEAIREHEAACELTLQETLETERASMSQKMDAELQERFNAEKKIWREMVDLETKEKLMIEQAKWTCEREKELSKMKEKETEIKKKIEESLREKFEKRLKQERVKIRDELQAEMKKDLMSAQETEGKVLKEELKGNFQTKLEEEKKKLEEEYEKHLKNERERVLNKANEKVVKEREEMVREFDGRLSSEREMILEDFQKKLAEEKEKFMTEQREKFEEKFEQEKACLEDELERRVSEEKDNMKDALSAKFEERLKQEIERAREKLEQAAKMDLEHMRASFDDEAQLDYDELKARLEAELRAEYSVLQEELEAECERTVERERELVEVRLGREVARAVQEEEERWRSRLEETLKDRLAVEEDRWNTMIETHLVSRLHAERDKWQAVKEQEVQEEKGRWREEWEKEKQDEVDRQREEMKTKVDIEMKKEIEKIRESLEEKFHSDLQHEVGVAVQEAREAWQREYTRKMALNTSSAHVSQGLLKEEIENLQTELLKKTENWGREKQELMVQKDTERREALESLRLETENEYQQLVQQHSSTLEAALKTARDQHTKDKAELEERYQNQMRLLQERLQKEKLLMERQLSELSCELNKWRNSDNTSSKEVQRLQAQLNKLKNQDDGGKSAQKVTELETKLKEIEAKVLKLTNEITEFEKKNSELSNQNDLLKRNTKDLTDQLNEIQKKKMELDNQNEKIIQKNKELSNQIDEISHKNKELSNQNEEICQKNKALTSENEGFVSKNKELTDTINEVKKHNVELKTNNENNEKRVKELMNELQSVSGKVAEYDRVAADLQKAKDLLREFKDELSDTQSKCQRFRHDAQDLHAKLARSEQNQSKSQAELDRLHEERSHLLDAVKSIEESYRADMAAYQQKLQESNARSAKSEKILQDMKHKYRLALESYRAALEAENEEAMKVMKRKHESILEAISRQQNPDREGSAKTGDGNLDKSRNSQTSVGNIEDTVQELRSHYLDTVAKIKDDVLRHVTQTNMRAAETVKTEIDKERTSTFEQIKDFYRKHAKQILESDNVGGDMERCLDAGLQAAQEALLSSAQSSRSTTPLSEDFLDTPRSRSTNRHAYIPGSRSRSTSRDTYGRDAGISPKGTRTVSFTDAVNNRGKFSSAVSYDDVRSPKGRILAKSPRDGSSELRLSREWNGEPENDLSFDTRRPDNRPRSAKLVRELRDSELRESRLSSSRSARDLHLSLRERHFDMTDSPRGNFVSSDGDSSLSSADKRKSRLLISTRDIHSGGRPSRMLVSESMSRSRSTGPIFSSSSSLSRPTSVPDLTTDDKEFSVWAETSLNETAPQFVTLRESRNASKSESNLNFSTDSPRDAGETPTSTPRRHRKHFTLHEFPTVDKISTELLTNGTSNILNDSSPPRDNGHSESLGFSPSKSYTPTRSERKNLPLIQFRHGRVQSLARASAAKSKSPHPDEPPVTSTPDKRSLSVQPSDLHMDF